MVTVVGYLVYKTTGLLVTHYGSSFIELLDELQLEPFPLGLHLRYVWPFLPLL